MAQTKINIERINGQIKTQDADWTLAVNDGGTNRNAVVVNGDEGSVSFPRQSYIRVGNGALTISNTTMTDLIYATVYNDTLSEYNNGTGLMTVKDDGVYLISYSCRWDNANAGRTYRTQIEINNSAAYIFEETVPAAVVRLVQNHTISLKLTAGQTINIAAYQNSGGNETISDNTLTITKVS